MRSSPIASMTCLTGSSSHSTDTKHWRLKYSLGAIVSSLAMGVLAGRNRERPGVDVAEPLPVLVHAPEQERHPAAVAFQERHPQPRMTREDAARAEGAGGQHHLERVRVDVLEHRVGAELLADLPELRARTLVEPERHLQLLERGPEWLVVRV